MRESSSYILYLVGSAYTHQLLTILGHFLKPEPEFVNLLRFPGINSQPGGIDSLESILGLLKRLRFQALIQWLLLNVKKKKQIICTSVYFKFSKSHLWDRRGRFSKNQTKYFAFVVGVQYINLELVNRSIVSEGSLSIIKDNLYPVP